MFRLILLQQRLEARVVADGVPPIGAPNKNLEPIADFHYLARDETGSLRWRESPTGARQEPL